MQPRQLLASSRFRLHVDTSCQSGSKAQGASSRFSGKGQRRKPLKYRRFHVADFVPAIFNPRDLSIGRSPVMAVDQRGHRQQPMEAAADLGWHAHKATMEDLYLNQKKPLKEVMAYMSEQLGFHATSVYCFIIIYPNTTSGRASMRSTSASGAGRKR